MHWPSVRCALLLTSWALNTLTYILVGRFAHSLVLPNLLFRSMANVFKWRITAMNHFHFVLYQWICSCCSFLFFFFSLPVAHYRYVLIWACSLGGNAHTLICITNNLYKSLFYWINQKQKYEIKKKINKSSVSSKKHTLSFCSSKSLNFHPL